MSKLARVEPPCTNRGVEHTRDGQAPLRVCLDWISVTFPAEIPFQDVFSFIGLDQSEFVELPKGMMFYRRRYQCGEITLLTDGQAKVDGLPVDMGHHLILRGKGCRQFEDVHGGAFDWVELLRTWRTLGCKFTRIDLAIDDRPQGIRPLFFSVDQIYEACDKDLWVGKMRSWEEHYSGRNSRHKRERARSVTIGAAQSLVRIRFYDKAAEQKLEGEEWTRTELQLRDERAGEAVDLLTGLSPAGFVAMGQLAFGILSHYIRFCDPSSDTNKSRWQVATWWMAFIAGVQKLSLAKVPEALATIPERIEWMKRQLGKTFALCARYFDGDLAWVSDIIRAGEKRLKRADYAILSRSLADFGLQSQVIA